VAAVSDFALIVLIAMEGFFCPVRNESPLHQRNLADWLLEMPPDHRDWLRGCDVVSRRPVVLLILSVEVLLNDLLSPGQSVATAHLPKIIAEDRATPRAIIAFDAAAQECQ